MFDGNAKIDAVEAYDGMVRRIALPNARAPQDCSAMSLPAGSIIVSADNHWSITGNIFQERFPAHLKDRAPRIHIRPDGSLDWVVNGKPLLPANLIHAAASFESVPGCIDIEPRMRDLDIERIDKEIVFGNGIGFFYGAPDLEVREWVFRIYNEHLAETARKAPGRFYGVGLINYWDMGRVRESISDLKALGLKTYLLPQNPKGADGAPLDYRSPQMEPLWTAAEEAGLPICFHVGEFFADGPGGHGTTGMVAFGPFRKTFGELVFGGIFDRHPSLQVVFAEAEINWVPGALQTATMLYETHKPFLDPIINHHPRHYWHNNCYSTFIYDPAGMRLIDIVGADRLLWSADYPHQESTLGFGGTAMQTVLDAVSEDEARMMLGGTAMKLFDLG